MAVGLCVIILVILFGKTAKLLLSSMVWVEETKDSLSLVTRQNMSFVINTGIWLVSLDCLVTLIVMKCVTENIVADVLG